MTKESILFHSAYVAPECEALELRFEGIVCTSIGQNQDVSESQTFGGFGGWE